MSKSFRMYGLTDIGQVTTYTRTGANINSCYQAMDSTVRDRIAKVGCAEEAQLDLTLTEEWRKNRVQEIRSGKVRDSYVLATNGTWVSAFGIDWNSSPVVVKVNKLVDHIPLELTIGPRKPIPEVPFEIHQDPNKFKNVDYMAAVRASCKGVK